MDQHLGLGEEVDDKGGDDGNSDGEGPVGFLTSASAMTEKEEEDNKRPHKKAKQDVQAMPTAETRL